MYVCMYIYIYADTTVYLGGAVIFSLAFSLAEFFEKAMKRERERVFFFLNIYIYTHIWLLWGVLIGRLRTVTPDRERKRYIYIYV